ncbi:hypothetical protein CEXT_109191 [Caerostris extrusa]|uniref:Uncharacterized protein n=1 Tax=Caerostris extrusa TaxID=172846 RepID=A0AAV4UH54_CAEEX|nr:hypothetical protein CEXT_109191 [Caerostris extrusa]
MVFNVTYSHLKEDAKRYFWGRQRRRIVYHVSRLRVSAWPNESVAKNEFWQHTTFSPAHGADNQGIADRIGVLRLLERSHLFEMAEMHSLPLWLNDMSLSRTSPALPHNGHQKSVATPATSRQ